MLGRCCCGPLLTAASCSAAQHWSTPRPRKTRDQQLLDAELEGRTTTSVRLQRMKIPWSS